MGWTGYHVNSPVRRKYECDKYNTWDEKNSSCEVLKSAQIGKVWYGACRHTDKKTGRVKVFGSVCLTNVDSKSYDNFWIKEMDETMGPFYNDCPVAILDLLTPTENQEALNWRRICRERAERKKDKNARLNALGIGSIIEFRLNDKLYRARKSHAAYQFKTSWWAIDDGYIKKKSIPDDFVVVVSVSK